MVTSVWWTGLVAGARLGVISSVSANHSQQADASRFRFTVSYHLCVTLHVWEQGSTHTSIPALRCRQLTTSFPHQAKQNCHTVFLCRKNLRLGGKLSHSESNGRISDSSVAEKQTKNPNICHTRLRLRLLC